MQNISFAFCFMSQQTSRLNAWSQTLPFPDPLRVRPLQNRLEMVHQKAVHFTNVYYFFSRNSSVIGGC